MKLNRIIALISVLFLFSVIGCGSASPMIDSIILLVSGANGDIGTGFDAEYTTGPLTITATSTSGKNIALLVHLEPDPPSPFQIWEELGIPFSGNIDYDVLSSSGSGNASISANGPSSLSVGDYVVWATIYATTGMHEIQATLKITIHARTIFIHNVRTSTDEIFCNGNTVSVTFDVYNNSGADITVYDSWLCLEDPGNVDVTLDYQIDDLQFYNITIQPNSSYQFDYRLSLTVDWTSASNSLDPTKITPWIDASSIQSGIPGSIITRLWKTPNGILLPKQLAGACAGVYQDNIYCFGGIEIGPMSINRRIYKLDTYDLVAGFSDVGALNIAVFHAGVASTDMGIYIVGGATNILATTQTDTIQYWNGGSIQEVGSLQGPRAGCSVIFWDDRLYIFGGYNNTGTLNDVEVFDTRIPGSIASKIGYMPRYLAHLSTQNIDNYFFVLGGTLAMGANIQGTNEICYTSSSFDNWYFEDYKMIQYTCAAASTQYDNTIWVVGGKKDQSSFVSICQRYSLVNPEKSEFAGIFPYGVAYPAFVTHKGYFYVLGGQTGANMLTDIIYRMDLR